MASSTGWPVVAGALLERHLQTSPRVVPPRDRPLQPGPGLLAQGETWSEDDVDLGGAVLAPAVRSALLVNLLTEDNLPHDFRDVERRSARRGWGRGAAVDGRGGPPLIAIRDYLTVTRAVDPVELERAAWPR